MIYVKKWEALREHAAHVADVPKVEDQSDDVSAASLAWTTVDEGDGTR